MWMVHHQLTTILEKKKAEENILPCMFWKATMSAEFTSKVMVQAYLFYTGCCPEYFGSSSVNWSQNLGTVFLWMDWIVSW